MLVEVGVVIACGMEAVRKKPKENAGRWEVVLRLHLDLGCTLYVDVKITQVFISEFLLAMMENSGKGNGDGRTIL